MWANHAHSLSLPWHRLQDIKSFKNALVNRRRTIYDFQFQVYDTKQTSLSSSDPRNSVFLRPKDWFERAQWKSAIHDMSMWLSLYAIPSLLEITMGAGRAKLWEATRFVRVSKDVFLDREDGEEVVDMSDVMFRFNHELHVNDDSFVDLGYPPDSY